jgi:hypothetical protein
LNNFVTKVDKFQAAAPLVSSTKQEEKEEEDGEGSNLGDAADPGSLNTIEDF